MKLYSVTEVLSKYVDWGRIPEDILAAACQRGSLVHTACESYALIGYASRLPDMYHGYFISFKNWYKKYVAATILAEQRMDNLIFGFTGKPDFVFTLHTGEVALVDLKTAGALSKTWRCQLAAYEYLLSNNGVKVDTILSLRLRIDGGEALGKRYDGEVSRDFAVFRAALTAHRNLV